MEEEEGCGKGHGGWRRKRTESATGAGVPFKGRKSMAERKMRAQRSVTSEGGGAAGA